MYQRSKGAEKVVLVVRDQSSLGAEKIRDILLLKHEEFGLRQSDIPSVRTIHRIFKENSRIISKVRKTKRNKTDYYQSRVGLYPNHIVECDAKEDHYLQGKPFIVFSTIDHYCPVKFFDSWNKHLESYVFLGNFIVIDLNLSF